MLPDRAARPVQGAWTRLAAACVLLLAAACAPRVELPGPAAVTPLLTEDAAVMADDYRLPLRTVLPEGEPAAVIVALHGFNDYSNAFTGQAEAWRQRGIATYAYDQRGFGASRGRGLWHGDQALVDDVRTVVSLVKARHPGIPVTLVGESMGGAVTLAAMAADPRVDADGIVLSAPAVWGRAVMPWWQRWPLWFFSNTLPWLEVAPRLRIKASDNIEMLKKLGRDPLYIRRTRIDAVHGLVGLMDRAYDGVPDLGHVMTKVPTVLLLGAREDVLPGRTVDALVRRMPTDAPWRMAVYESGYHMLTRDLNGDIVVQDIAQFALDPSAPLPSGQERQPGTFEARAPD